MLEDLSSRKQRNLIINIKDNGFDKKNNLLIKIMIISYKECITRVFIYIYKKIPFNLSNKIDCSKGSYEYKFE